MQRAAEIRCQLPWARIAHSLGSLKAVRYRCEGLLRAGHTDYVINDAALEYMREHAVAGTLAQRLATQKRRRFADEKAWTRHLERLGIADLPVTPVPVRVATDGALWGAVNAHGSLQGSRGQ
jgi:hypothetical protein